MKRFVTALAVIALIIGWTSETAAGQFVPANPINEHEYEDVFEEFYASLAPGLNSLFALPEKVELTSASCGEANAFFDPQELRVIFCSELLEGIGSGAAEASSDEAVQALIIAAQALFILQHEIGHALIHVLDLPALGQEEDVADQLSALLMTNEPILAMWAADLWRTLSGVSGGQQMDARAFADTHDLDEQRYYNLMCWAYGADPLVRAYIVVESGLPPERSQSCQQEYAQMSSSWERLLSPHLKDPAMFAEEFSPKRNTSGYWRFVESMEDATGEVRCTASGTMGLWQVGEDLTGEVRQEGLCVAYGTPSDNAAEAGIESGAVTGSTVTFTVAGCAYTGRLQNAGATTVDGTVTCTSPELELSGNWMAVR